MLSSSSRPESEKYLIYCRCVALLKRRRRELVHSFIHSFMQRNQLILGLPAICIVYPCFCLVASRIHSYTHFVYSCIHQSFFAIIYRKSINNLNNNNNLNNLDVFLLKHQHQINYYQYHHLMEVVMYLIFVMLNIHMIKQVHHLIHHHMIDVCVKDTILIVMIVRKLI